MLGYKMYFCTTSSIEIPESCSCTYHPRRSPATAKYVDRHGQPGKHFASLAGSNFHLITEWNDYVILRSKSMQLMISTPKLRLFNSIICH